MPEHWQSGHKLGRPTGFKRDQSRGADDVENAVNFDEEIAMKRFNLSSRHQK